MAPSHPPMRPGLRRLESESDVLEQLAHYSPHTRPSPTSAPNYQTALPHSEGQYHNGGNGSNGQHHTTVAATNADDREPDMYAYELPLELKNKQRWQDKHHPTLYIKAKYLPYRALRQQFWRAMLKQYDADESGKIDKVELITMLDTLGSTLHNSTIDGFFLRWKEENRARGLLGGAGGGEERKIITMDQAVICLEEQLMKSREVQGQLHRPHWHRDQSTRSSHGGQLAPGGMGPLESSPDVSPGGGSSPYLGGVEDGGKLTEEPTSISTRHSSIPALEVSDVSEPGEPDSSARPTPTTPGTGSNALNPYLSRTDSWESEADLNDDAESREEHVVEIQECPICHMPRLNARGGRKKNGRRRAATDADIITHIATCASSDWRAVNNLVMAGFVTSSQAQRKWYSKVVTKISYGGYKLGANSANILVQDRITGMINEERMSVYVCA